MRMMLMSGVVALSALACDTRPDPRRTNFRVERDNVVAQYDDKTGRLKRLEVDTNKDGKTDTWTYAEGTRIERIEVDRNGDGTIDRWEYYGAKNILEKIGTSTRGDDVADEWAFPRADGSLERVETDTDRDGRIDKWEAFDAPTTSGGQAVLRSVAFDTAKRGQPTQRIYYRADGSFERSEQIKK